MAQRRRKRKKAKLVRATAEEIQAIEAATVAYYESMTPEEKAEDAAWARLGAEVLFSCDDWE